LAHSQTEDLFALDTYLSNVDWGRTELISYDTAKGQRLQAALILPPGYEPGQRYPTLVWVYGGYMVRGLDDYWLDPFLPGIYNLQLYAARGYAVLIPSMPLPSRSERKNVYDALGEGVLPAVDKLVELGIADPQRVGVMGQSFGGYSVYGLISQTDRFKAAVAMAGITDLRSHFGQFSPLARGYPGIEHEMSDNWAEMDLWGLDGPPRQGEQGYDANSPLTQVDRVHTPLLMIHGDLDNRGSVEQAEQFFYGLYAQGKTAKLLRYGGESHSLAQSPANVRDIFQETISWLDKYLQ
jgi:dipeptidyl aminopeptidase/acylaminoacyl peptidase